MKKPPIELHRIANDVIELSVTNYGGRVISLKAPDRHGRAGDVVLGYDDLQQYLTDEHYFGALVGRYANRIANGRFALGGRTHQITCPPGGHALHGGRGLHSKFWEVEAGARSLQLICTSPDGDDGFPGTLHIEVRYSLVDDELHIEYAASTDEDTVINLTSHSYFNLAGAGHPTVLDHELTLHAHRFTPIDRALIPTGELRDVAGTPFDFRTPRRIGDCIDAQDEQIRFAGGYDHNWVLDRRGADLTLAAQVHEPTSGRVLQVLTREPGLQFYSGNLLNGVRGKESKAYPRRSGFCLETQHFPDSPNRPAFPSTTLRAGQRFASHTVYRFDARG